MQSKQLRNDTTTTDSQGQRHVLRATTHGKAKGPQVAKVGTGTTDTGALLLPLKAAKVPGQVPKPSPTPDNLGIVAYQEGLLLADSYAPTLTAPQFGPHLPSPADSVRATWNAAPMAGGVGNDAKRLPLPSALAQVKAGDLQGAALLMSKATKRFPVAVAPEGHEPGAYLPLVKVPSGAVAKAHRAAQKALLLAVSELAQVAPGDRPSDRAKWAKAAVSAVVVSRRVHGGMEATTTGTTPGSIDADAPLAVALRPRGMVATLAAQVPQVKAPTVEGRRHAYRLSHLGL